MTDPRQALAERLFAGGWQSLELMTVYLGDALGLYRALAEQPAATVAELAGRTGIAERYAQEWLESQAASGFLTVDEVSAEPAKRRYSISAAHAEVLTDRDSPFSAAPIATLVTALAQALPKLKAAFRTGAGIAWQEYGPELVAAQGDFNRPWLRTALVDDYLPAVADVHQRLQAGPARVADLACGAGWAAIAIATAYPQTTVDGYDVDETAVALARKHAAEAGVAGRVTFTRHDLTTPLAAEPYHLAVVIEAVHDLARPVEFLRTARDLLAPGGTAIVAEENVGESFTAPAEGLDALFYAASVLSCLPAGLAEQPSAATGTVIRPATMRRYATEAGFSQVSILDQLQHDSYRFFRLDP